MRCVEPRSQMAALRVLSRFAYATAMCAVLAAPAAAQQTAGGSVGTATFTSNVAEGAPVDFRQAFGAETRVVYYYSEILGLQGRSVTHRWKFDGTVMQEVKLPVKRERQAVWSLNHMHPERIGNWTVEVVDPRGKVIRIDNFAYNPSL